MPKLQFQEASNGQAAIVITAVTRVSGTLPAVACDNATNCMFQEATEMRAQQLEGIKLNF